MCKYKETKPIVTNVELVKYLEYYGKFENNRERKLDNGICVTIKKVTCNENYISGNVAIHSSYNVNRETNTFLRSVFNSLDELYNTLSIEQI